MAERHDERMDMILGKVEIDDLQKSMIRKIYQNERNSGSPYKDSYV